MERLKGPDHHCNVFVVPVPVQGNKDIAMRAKADDVLAGLRRVTMEHRHFGSIDNGLPLKEGREVDAHTFHD